MKAFSEKSDIVLRSLITSTHLSWDKFTELTNITRDDAILVFLKNRELIEYSDQDVRLTGKGRVFINFTSFVELMESKQHT